MASNFCLKVDNVDCPTPAEFNWSRQRVSSPDSGRTLDGLMHVEQVTQKEKIGLKWLGCTPETAATILGMFDPEYIQVTYLCPLTNAVVTKTFYTGDRSAPYYWWCDGGRHTEISFNIIER